MDKGIKVRVPGIKSFQLTGEALGYIPSPIPFSEAFTAIQTGVVDGVIGSGAEGYYQSFRDVTKAYYPSEYPLRVLVHAHQRAQPLRPGRRRPGGPRQRRRALRGQAMGGR
ncbi:MAG: hypothetical protein U5L11_16025 [Arhodomonas sp.]|nr:hypothetical protein [Arhodomonas sp.]